jgi:hypothetical protein
LKDTAQEIAIQLDDQHQATVKRQIARNRKQRKKVNAVTQNENEEYTCHDMESDKENEHESEQEQERSNSEDGNALESEQEKQKVAQLVLGPITTGWT